MNIYEYDKAVDNSWMDALCGLMDQSPENSEFSVVTKDMEIGLSNYTLAEEFMYDMPLYSGASGVRSLPDAAADNFSASNSKKILILTAASCADYNSLFQKITQLDLPL